MKIDPKMITESLNIELSNTPINNFYKKQENMQSFKCIISMI